MHEHTELSLSRDVPAIQIPSGEKIVLKKDAPVIITQSLGGSYTVATETGLARIDACNADALGLERPVETEAESKGPADEKAVWEVLRTCYDPEIPVNIVDLGLIYDCTVLPQPGRGASVSVKMTLTAPGCGMGPAIAADAESRILALDGVDDATVEVVWDPPWNQEMISEAGKMKLGMI
jgi:probable FeS assembly SUF system protein SufT